MDMNPIPSFKDWYNEVTKNAEEKIREYFKKQKQKKKLELPF
jgi:(p)ppGpp synthase/HD superfamily hydrolase